MSNVPIPYHTVHTISDGYTFKFRFTKVTMMKHGEMIMENFQIEHSITYLQKMHSRHWGIPEVLN